MRLAAIVLILSGALALEQVKLQADPAPKLPDIKAPEVLKAPRVKVFPVPTTSRCIIIICIQYMVVYTALALCRTYLEITGAKKGKLEGGLKAASQTMTYGPMICVLFIACRMRVEFLSDGKDEPQAWVQNCMYALTFAVMASTMLVMVLSLFSGAFSQQSTPRDLEEPDTPRSPNKCVVCVMTILRYMILLGLYGGLGGVMVGILTYLPPGATELNKLPSPAPAISCTMILTVVFFSTQLVIAVCRSVGEFTGVDFPRVIGMMNAAATTVEFAPMLSILFLAARMRALQHDGQPQAWAQNCMYGATFAMCLTTGLSCAVPVVMGGTVKQNPVTKEATFEVPNKAAGFILLACRCICMLGFYGGAVGVIYSIFTFEAPAGPEHTLPVSPTVQCVVNLTCQFFFVYLMITIMSTVSEVSGGAIQMNQSRLFRAVDSARSTLTFAPMLSILFVTTRMYALLITNKQGAPQAWVQDGMFMATWSLLISLVMCIASGLVMDNVETDEDGNVVSKGGNSLLRIVLTVIRYLSMLLLYGGITMIIYGLFVMTPETANGKGSLPFVSDAVDKTPLSKPPPSPDQVQASAEKSAKAGLEASKKP